ncbi:hypothetical protein [Acidiphilium sp. C61]|uniref:hypothetical protein n=1 Tax=Acidiphilium sp. C61 TaxID=1671485 RepID=UPI00157AE868|nr:hypothetical protein [Acidiphilium sp. C61]
MEQNRSRRAAVYAAWGQKFVEEAVVSARTARRFGLDRILITSPDSSRFLDCEDFTEIIYHDFKLQGQLAKTEIFARLPDCYSSFVFLDTDTQILLDISQAFERAEQHGIAAAQAAHYSLEHFWGFGSHLDKIGFRSNELLQYNTGVIFFSRQPKAWQVLEKWHEFCTEVKDDVSAWGDQPYLTLAMELLQFNPYTLSIAYNYRNFGEIVSGKIRIWHSRIAPPADVNTFADPWPPRRFRDSQRLGV